MSGAIFGWGIGGLDPEKGKVGTVCRNGPGELRSYETSWVSEC